MKSLEEWRREIDDVDEKIIKLIAQRQKLVDGLMRLKKEKNMAAAQPVRFKQILRHCREMAHQNNLDQNLIDSIWLTMHDYFLKMEKEFLEQKSNSQKK